MSGFLRVVKIVLLLVSLLTLLISLPAFLFGVAEEWQIIFLSLSYFWFFLSTVWRTIRYGDLAKRSEDQQVQRSSGRLASLVLVIGLLGVHWLAIYDFSVSKIGENSAIKIALILIATFLVMSSIIINQSAIRTLGIFFDRLTIKSEHRLIRTGIYSVVRHPIYLSYILLFSGFCIMLQSLVGLGLLAVVCVVWFGNRIMIEEEMLAQEFGEDYTAYQQQTKKIFPLIY